jgi:hypothetical protein
MYFISFYKFKCNKSFERGHLENFIICTNTDFYFRQHSLRKKDVRPIMKAEEHNELKWNIFFVPAEDLEGEQILCFAVKEGKKCRFKDNSQKRDATAEVV